MADRSTLSFSEHGFTTDDSADGLCDYLNASPSPFHACETSAAMLEAAGFVRLLETEVWPSRRGRYFVVRGGSLIAWSTEYAADAASPLRVVGAHTDSPSLRVKPQPDVARGGWQLLGVEVYGGTLDASWLDRDLGLSGRVAVRSGDEVEGRLLRVDEPVLRVSQLAPHLDRSVRSEGLKLNAQQHMMPHWGLGETPGDFRAYVGEQLGVAPADVLGWDVMTHDLNPAARTGRSRETVAGARQDNLATSYAATRALIAAVEVDPVRPVVPVIALFDHEEVGSVSERGAASSYLITTLERVAISLGGSREHLFRAIAGGVVASGDMAHATHPNYSERHEPSHTIAMNGGPVLKTNTNLRYATDAMGAAAFRLACEQAGVPCQEFVSRSDLPCGSTVGPITSALTGATTVDFGAPTLSMHSTRELTGSQDQAMYAAALACFLSPA
ncbi:M18 family aminopeptidase [Luteipulveratus halotolerans]|uniref:M18 family aminopeptidase n=1 Tax=Luteipulveratus halotolerans TaxID=1631356 RepID=A0A0L6CH65_9MICO|nr:M18 family aminopeptidase [Luteipulveratus halotolerans]KNX37151.1 aminopeptidase 2 [Luteipulveratus halotolerans]